MIHILAEVTNAGPLSFCGHVLNIENGDRFYAGYNGHLATCPGCLRHLCDGLQAQADQAYSHLVAASSDWIAAYNALRRLNPEAVAGMADPTRDLRCAACNEPAGVRIPECVCWEEADPNAG